MRITEIMRSSNKVQFEQLALWGITIIKMANASGIFRKRP